MSKGKIGVTTENIFPVIKKFLYSDHEIFLRELVSNAIDATRKLQTLVAFGDYKGETGNLDVRVKIDKEAGTLTISDHGIGMDADDIEKYINQIAFSGAEEFLAKYKDTANSIIGHFGLGFYSAFMVSKKVEIISLSYKEGAKPVKWTCDGSPEFEMEETEKAERGTDVVLYIDDESKEFLDQVRIDALLKKYCRFLPVPIISGKEQEWKDGKYVDTDKDKVINATEPLWTRKPADLTDEDYLKFYHELMPGKEDPMFWIHLNVDYPFELTGILYFPKIHSNIDIPKNNIQLYCNKVYVTDQVEGVVPEFMTLLQGVIDSPDIPLNVSRSYLQADTAVKKISGYISKKVAEKLDKMFADNRAEYEKKWDDISIFIEFGMLTDDKFYEDAKKFFLMKDTDGKYYTLEEYKTLVAPEQTDKDGTVVFLYATDKTAQYSYIQAAVSKGYSVLMMGGQLDAHIISRIEQESAGKLKFVRVDSDIPERLIAKADDKKDTLDEAESQLLTTVFRVELPTVEKAEFVVSAEALAVDGAPATITQSEYMRRMKEMAAMQPQMSFFGQMPDSYNLIINTDQPTVKKLLEEAKAAPGLMDLFKIAPKAEEDKNDNEAKAEDKAEETKEDKPDADKAVKEWADKQPLVRQIIDLALLQAGLLKGEELNKFVRRSIELL